MVAGCAVEVVGIMTMTEVGVVMEMKAIGGVEEEGIGAVKGRGMQVGIVEVVVGALQIGRDL